MEARSKVAFPDLGTQTGLKMRLAMTGARLLEVSGVSSVEKVEILTARLRVVLNAVDVWVSRPTKIADLRIDRLDDVTTPDEVVADVARVGGCPPKDGRSSEIYADGSELGAIWCDVRWRWPTTSPTLSVYWWGGLQRG